MQANVQLLWVRDFQFSLDPVERDKGIDISLRAIILWPHTFETMFFIATLELQNADCRINFQAYNLFAHIGAVPHIAKSSASSAFYVETRPNEFGSMTARKDDTSQC